MSKPRVLTIETTVGDTIPIVFQFDASVDAGAFAFTHSAWGTISVSGVGQQVSIPVTESRAALAAGTYSWVLVANEGVEGSEQTVARGSHKHEAR